MTDRVPRPAMTDAAEKTGPSAVPAYWRGLEALEDSPEYRAAVEKEFPSDLAPITDPVSRRKFLGLMGAAMALGLKGHVELVDQSQPRERQIAGPGLFQSDIHVLDEVLDEEARIEIVIEDPPAEVHQRPTAGRSRCDRLHHRLQIEPGPIAVKQALADADHAAGD